MKKLYALLLWGFFTYAVGVAQPVNNLVGDIVMPAPNAASLGEYTDVPVSHFTGVPDIGIAIYTLQEGPISLPVSLSYHASGIRVAQTASWVGLGWSLNAGGMITRTVQGLPDEDDVGYYNEGDNLTDSQNDFLEVIQNQRDPEPDIFSFNFPGYSGKFYFDGNKTPHFIPKQDLQLIFNPGGGNIAQFDGFTIVTPTGTRYIFGKVTRDESTVTAWEETKSTGEPAYKISSWYLLRVESADRNYAIELNYVSDYYSYKSPVTCSYVKSSCTSGNFSSSSAGTQCTTDIGYGGGSLYIPTNVRTVKLSSIECSTSTVTFLSNTTRQDLDPGETSSPTTEALDSIKIESGSAFCQKFIFSYDYFKDPRATINLRSESKRLKLLSVQQTSCEPNPSITIPPYTFEYFGTLNTDGSSFFPHLLDKGVDHWGFYNGADGYDIPNSNDTKPNNNNNLVNVPPTTVSTPYGPVSYGSSDRETHEIFVKYATLQKINYPTGGSTTFEFEPHSYAATTQEQFDLLTNPFTSCPGPYQGNCCDTKSNTSTIISFNSQGEIDSARYDLIIDRDNSGCTASNPSPSVKIEVLSSTGTVLGMNMFSLAEGEDIDSIANVPLSTLATLTDSTEYRFRITTFNGYGRFYLYLTRTVPSQPLVGGLRVKRLQIHDGISSANDIVRTYEYSKSSLFFQPTYGHFVTGYVLQEQVFPLPPTLAEAQTVTISSESIVPLSSFQGYHIGYREVEEIYGDNKSDNGFSTYRFNLSNFEYYSIKDMYPLPPLQANVLNGKTSEQLSRDASDNIVSSSTFQPRYPNTTSSTTYMFKTSPSLTCPQSMGSPSTIPLVFITPYTMQSPTDYQLLQQTETVDGVSTVTTYGYDNQDRHLAPTSITTTNSDGKKHRTLHTYIFDKTEAVYDTMEKRNIIAMPVQTEQEVETDPGTDSYILVDGTRTNYAIFDSSTGMETFSPDSSDDPYPQTIYRLERTWNSAGMLQFGVWELQGTFLQYYGTGNSGRGYPFRFQKRHWQPETYQWNNGLITRRTFQLHVWQYAYHPNTRLLQSITDRDGQVVEFEYDDLMRLHTASARADNVISSYDYVYKDGSNLHNYVKTKIAYQPVTGSALDSMVTLNYFDGLGRSIQTVLKQHSTLGRDVVTAISYDKQGRVRAEYEPFQRITVDGSFAGIPGSADSTLYEYEASPLNRIWAVTPPEWYTTFTEYAANDGGDVFDYSAGAFYPANSLMQVVQTDPEGNQTITFKDKRGRLVCSKQKKNADEISTYYVYDDKDRLSLVLPPTDGGSSEDSTALHFSYVYDQADNITQKKMPGAVAVTMQYSDMDLLTGLQDGNMAAINRWLVTQYDTYGRPTKTGFYNNPVAPNADVPNIDTLLTETFYDGGFGVNAASEKQYYGQVRKSTSRILGTNDFLESIFDYDQHGRNTFTQSNNHINLTPGSEELTYLYDWADNVLSQKREHQGYENYTLLDSMNYDQEGRLVNVFHKINSNALQQLCQLDYTAKDELKTKALGKVGSNWLQEVNYSYNAQGWLTQINEPLGVVSSVQSLSSTPGDLFYMKLLYDEDNDQLDGDMQRNGNISSIEWQVQGEDPRGYGYQYDFLNRLTQATYGAYSGGSMMANNNYSTSYSYDPRGNIEILTRNGLYAGAKQQIDDLRYAYDEGSNQMRTITDKADCPINLEFNNPIEHNGLIQATNSITLKPGTSISGQEVTITAANCSTETRYTGGFEQRSIEDYEYDDNGNMTKDPNKKVNIIYNYLNLPQKVTWYDDGTAKQIEWVYDAAGQKLQKIVKKDAIQLYSRDNFGVIEYKNEVLDKIYQPEGFAEPNGSSFDYFYFLKDHLSTPRVTFKNSGGSPVIVSEFHSYPYGAPIAELSEGVETNDHTYNEKELENDFGLDWFDYGNRQRGLWNLHWNQVDRFAEKYATMSPYSYAANNPIRNVDINGDSVWVTSKTYVDSYGNNVTDYTVNVTGKVLDLSGVNEKNVADGVNNFFKKMGGGWNDSNGARFNVSYNVNFTTASSMDEVLESDHLIVVVDDVLGKGDPKLGGGEAGGLAGTGKVAYIEYGTESNMIATGVHEFGHNMGLGHAANGTNNIMSYDQLRTNFTKSQHQDMLFNAMSGTPNQGSNRQISTETTNNWFYHTSTNEKPWLKNTQKGQIIPKTLINPNK